jgi:acetyl esterase/lipase
LTYCSGGGFSLDGEDDHIRFWADDVASGVNAGSRKNVAFLFLAYTLVPFATYPTQIYEAAECLKHVLTELGRSPSDVTIAGDSAGANICLALLSLMLHPSNDLPEVHVDKPLKAMVLLGPWLSFKFDYPSMTVNAQKDICAVPSEAMWARDYLAGKPSTPYAEPLDADAEWWKGAELKVSHCFASSGSHEILVDHTIAWAAKYRSVTPEEHFELVIGNGECHIAPIIEPLLCDSSPTEQGDAIKTFFKTHFTS